MEKQNSMVIEFFKGEFNSFCEREKKSRELFEQYVLEKVNKQSDLLAALLTRTGEKFGEVDSNIQSVRNAMLEITKATMQDTPPKEEKPVEAAEPS